LRQPNDPVGLQRLALAEVHLRETASAEQHARKAVQLDARSAESWNTLGLVQLQRGRARDAAQSFAAAVKAQRDFASALLNLAVVNQQYLGDRAAALKWYEAYLSLRPPPGDAAAVREVIKQLQLELTPVRPAGQTQAPPVEPLAGPTSAPPPLAQAPLVSVPVVKSAPPSSPPPGAKLVTPEPEPRAPPAAPPTRSVAGEPVRSPPTVVTVPPEPVIKSASAPPPSAVAVAAPAPASVPSSATVAPAVSEAPPARRGFLQSLNPLNLFHGKNAATAVTPLPAARSRVAAGSSTNFATEEPSLSESAAGGEAQIATVSTGDRAAAQRHFERGLQAMKSRQFVLANESFRAATVADPGWFQAQLNHAAAAIEAGEFAEAITAARAALTLDPTAAEARFNLALALKRSHRDPEAARELERLLQANPDDVRAHLTLGNLYAGTLANPGQARSHYQKVLTLAPDHPQATAIRFWLAAHPQ
jgi:tetratricopeptide (TPR) repeat protein